MAHDNCRYLCLQGCALQLNNDDVLLPSDLLGLATLDSINHPTNDYVHSFRNSSPYINAHRGRTFVVLLDGYALQHPNFANIINDLALLNSLGVRLVLAFGARPQILERLERRSLSLEYVGARPVITNEVLEAVKDAAGSAGIEIQSLLSMGLPNSPMHGASLRVASGNMITARPVGVLDGKDFGHTGQVRKVDCGAINRQLDDGTIVLLPPLGFSPTGEVFSLSVEEVATRAAIELKADKLIVFSHAHGLRDESGEVIRVMPPREASRHLEALDTTSTEYAALYAAWQTSRFGVNRAHLISYQQDGALIEDLFTRNGSGTMVTQELYEQVRDATIEDVGGILELIRPLEEQGVLVRRSRERLENEIDLFTVVELDGMMIGCAALYPFTEEGIGELACVAVHAQYQGGQRGDLILQHIEKRANRIGLNRLFVLTTHTAHWFRERGFEPADVDALPRSRQELYNWQRNSKVFVKAL
ncbi:amino-acid N-acetyltransferase [Oceanospirillum maris]|jgi:amino-acid N-acetyltransferase|uniref:amino-acid N-acetyltransferase n=1 Tax=Oceanospirillum maris TaxID=64977 RepID=UPI0003F631FD